MKSELQDTRIQPEDSVDVHVFPQTNTPSVHLDNRRRCTIESSTLPVLRIPSANRLLFTRFPQDFRIRSRSTTSRSSCTRWATSSRVVVCV